MLQDVLAKSLTPDYRRELVCHVRGAFGVGARQGCWALQFHRLSHRAIGGQDDQAALRQRIRGEIAAVRIRYGYPRIHALLQQEGQPQARLLTLPGRRIEPAPQTTTTACDGRTPLGTGSRRGAEPTMVYQRRVRHAVRWTAHPRSDPGEQLYLRSAGHRRGRGHPGQACGADGRTRSIMDLNLYPGCWIAGADQQNRTHKALGPAQRWP